MARYKSDNQQHRTWLASNILDLLVKWGFSIDNATEKSWEFVCSRESQYKPGEKIIIYTSIEKVSGAMRLSVTDRIRVIKQSNEMKFTRVARINRTGEFSEINKRICKAIKKAQCY
tara:strand:+ start:296 stop:643 length:348 start_codon:yes stop_codon:yes gene_type:complete